MVEIMDNGKGIKAEELQRLLRLKEGVEDAIRHKRYGEHLEAGGKALINIFARLYLIYGERTIFRMENTGEKGFHVVIGGPLSE